MLPLPYPLLLLLLLLLLPHRKLSLSRKLPCSKCNGSGSKSGKRDTCETCHGSGVQVMIRPIGPGMVQQIQQPCRECSGNGFCVKPSKHRTVFSTGSCLHHAGFVCECAQGCVFVAASSVHASAG
jgi:RecJ-like exonuclease